MASDPIAIEPMANAPMAIAPTANAPAAPAPLAIAPEEALFTLMERAIVFPPGYQPARKIEAKDQLEKPTRRVKVSFWVMVLLWRPLISVAKSRMDREKKKSAEVSPNENFGNCADS
jgi:hypothetical protein